eukprot:scaffold3807_cov184-Cylindrotheca_fusiformis.AAC.1
MVPVMAAPGGPTAIGTGQWSSPFDSSEEGSLSTPPRSSGGTTIISSRVSISSRILISRIFLSSSVIVRVVGADDAVGFAVILEDAVLGPFRVLTLSGWRDDAMVRAISKEVL